MKRPFLICLVIVAVMIVLYLVAPNAWGQSPTHIQFYSTFDKDGIHPIECSQEAAIVAPLTVKYGSPVGWTWVIACDDAAWERIQARTVLAGIQGVVGMTDLPNHRTFVRGYVVLHPMNNTADAQPAHIIAHELGHVLLQTADEKLADRKADELMKGSVLVAAR